MSKKTKPYQFPKEVFVTHEVDGDSSWNNALDDIDSIDDGVKVAIYELRSVMIKHVKHGLLGTVKA